MKQWTGWRFGEPRKSDLEQLNEKQRECAALQHRIAELEGNLALALEGEEHMRAAAVQAEREECAKLLLDAEGDANDEDRGWLKHCAARIRERGGK